MVVPARPLRRFPSIRAFLLRTVVMSGLHGRSATVDLGRSVKFGAHTRQPSDIDSLSPEVVAALQSTFQGKLNQLRSQASLERQRAEAKPSPLQPVPSGADSEEVDSENEGTFLIVAYVAGILASILVLATARGRKEEEDVSCRGAGDTRCVRLYGYILPIGFTGISLVFALVLSVFDISFGVYNVLTTTEKFFLTATIRLSDVPQVVLSYTIDIGFAVVAVSLLWLAKASAVDPLFTLCEEGIKLYWTFGLTTMATVIFWCAVNSIKYPVSTHLYMRRAAKVVSVLLLFFSASSSLYKILLPPRVNGPCQAPEAAEVVNGTTADHQLQLYYKGWLVEVPDLESKQVRLYSEAHKYDWVPMCALQCPVHEELPRCKPRAKPDVCEVKEDDLGMCPASYNRGTCELRDDQGTCEARYDEGMCEARYDRGICEARYDEGMCEARDDQGMCEARYDQGTCKPRSVKGVCPPRWKNEMCEAVEWGECQWPWLKRIQPYERKDKCKYDLPVCDWPLAKRIQVYESKELCKYNCPSCDWPLVKRIQVYSRDDRCGTLTLPQCDWPYLKQIQRYEARGRCYGNEQPQCEWPFRKQLQSYTAWDSCSALHYEKCDWPAESRLVEANERRNESLAPPA